MNLKKLAIIVFILSSISEISQAQNLKLCVNGSAQVFARSSCLVAEKPFAATTPAPTATPSPSGTPSGTAGLLNLTTCRKVSTTAASNVGVATAAFQCDLNNEFVLSYGFSTSDGFKSDASVRRQEIRYGAGGNLPAGVSVTMEGSRARNYNLNLTATCCKR